jgi:hypothetical protein
VAAQQQEELNLEEVWHRYFQKQASYIAALIRQGGSEQGSKSEVMAGRPLGQAALLL